MGCNCGQKKMTNNKAVFVYTSLKGKSTTYNTEVEAKAAQIRQGGGHIRTVTR